MNTKLLSFHLVAGCSLSLLAGCMSEPSSRVVSAPPPPPPATVTATSGSPVVVTTPATTTTGQTTTTTVSSSNLPPNAIIVTQSPPALQQEPVLARPSTQHMWIPGYYTWRENRYVWMAGRWEIPPRTNATWVAPRWTQESSGYRFYEGYWN